MIESLQSDHESSDEEEPKLKYVRLGNDLKRVLMQDAISTVKVHDKVSENCESVEPYIKHPYLHSTSAWERTWVVSTYLTTWET